MSINKLPKIKSYWECGQYVRNEGIRNTMSKSRFEEILQNFHFSDNTKDDTSIKAFLNVFLMIVHKVSTSTWSNLQDGQV